MRGRIQAVSAADAEDEGERRLFPGTSGSAADWTELAGAGSESRPPVWTLDADDPETENPLEDAARSFDFLQDRLTTTPDA